MAEKQFALGGNRNASYLEDDDPLAELARIVGFQEQPAVQSRAGVAPISERREPVIAEFPSVAASAPDMAPQNPVADLEDELLRAFETYDAPRGISPSSPAAAEPRREAVPPLEPAYVAPPVQMAPEVHAQPLSPSVEEEDPFDALAAAVAASAPLDAALPVEPPAPVFAAEPVVAAVRPPMRSLATPLLPQAPKPVEAPHVEPVAIEPEFSVDLLEEELMQSLDEAVEVPSAPVVAQQSPIQSARTSDPVVDIAPEHADDMEIDWDFPGIDADDMVTLDPPEASSASVALRPAADHGAGNGSMDALLDDVSRYAVPGARTDASQRREPAFDAALAAISGVATDIDPPFGRSSYTTPAAVSAPLPEPVVHAAPAAEAPQAAEPDFGDFFSASDFELDIDELEQQLTDLDFGDVTSAGAAKAEKQADVLTEDDVHLEPFADFVPESAAEEPYVAAPAYQQPVEPVVAERSPAVAVPAPEPVLSPVPVAMATTASAASYSAFEPSYRAPQPVVPELEPGTDGNAQFDPAMLSEAEDPIETLSEIDVPELKVQEPEEPVLIEPDYDLDIDAEMATLFASLPNEPAQPAVKDNEQAFSSAFVASGNRAAASTDNFDEFEKALEDDFRTMLSQPLGQPRSMSGAPVQPTHAYAAKRAGSGSTLKTVLLAACATGVIALVGLGGYLVIGHSSGSTSSAPRIIAADKGPVKVVPENKGGVTVPNQDKAVYDRVAGQEADNVKQGTLVTTEEQPVDVVQKTLSADAALPGDGDQPQDVAPTPVEDTRDARLLPSDAKPATADSGTAAAVSAAPGGVAVRKVRTMIVKADGTLVPREDTPVEQAATAPAAADTGAQPRTDDTAAAPLSADTAVASTDQDLRTTGATTASPSGVSASSDALASVANSNVAAQPPVQVVKTTAVDTSSDNAPIPTARPSDQPVNVVSTVTEKGNVKAPAQTQETASIDQPAAATASAPPSGSYGIQIASLPSEADAKASIKKFAAKFSGVIGGRSIGIRQADIPGKGTYYRLRVDVGSKDQAIALCTKLKAAGGSCLVSK